MAFGFLDPGLIAFAAVAAAVPLVAHLIARTRPPEKRFPTVEFLRRANRRVWRLRRPRDLLLLALRTLALVLLGLAFLRPHWLTNTNASGSGDAKHLVLLVDRSGSMGAISEGQSCFSLARARAVDALRGAGKLDSVNLIWIDAVPDAVFPDMGRATAALESALNEATVSGENGDAAAAVKLAIDRLESLDGVRELIVVSDFQSESWSGPLPSIPDTIRPLLVPVGNPAPNLSLSNLELESATLLAGEPIRVIGKVRNHGDERRTVRVALTVDDDRIVREVAAAPRGESAFFAEIPAPSDRTEFLVKASIEGSDDALMADDDRWIVGRVREPLRVGLGLEDDSVTDIERELWSRLLRSFAWTREVDDIDRAELVVAAGNSAVLAERIQTLLAKGAGVLYRPTPAGGAPEPLDLFSPLDPKQGAWESRAPGESGWTMRIPADREDDPIFRLFTGGEYGNPAAGSTRQRWRLTEAADDSGTLLAYEDGMPALWKQSSESGHLWWWNLPINPSQSTWAQQPAFLPLVGEVILQSRPGEGIPAHFEVTPGLPATWEPTVFPEGGETVLLDSEGNDIPLTEDGTSLGALAYRTELPLQPGSYRWALRDVALEREIVLAHTTVNFPLSEMNLERADAASLEAWTEARLAGNENGIDWTRLRDGRPLWPWLAGLALCLLAVEAAILFRASRREEATPTVATRT